MIEAHDLQVTSGSFVLSGVSLSVPAGQYAVLMGRSGAGKTTLLEAICGIKPIASGRLILDDRDVTHMRPADRGIGFVPQEAALFSTLSVRDHLRFGPTVRRWGRSAIEARVGELAELLEIVHLLDRHPQGLSGGERQRVALGRAIAARPAVLCLDEPLSSLDDESRMMMHDLLRTIRAHTPVTTLHITHNIDDTRRLADRVFSLDTGSIRELDTNPVAHRP